MTELRKHRNVSEIIFGLILDGTLDPADIDGEMLLYPYNAALLDLPTNPAELSTRYGHDAIHAAMEAAKSINGVASEDWLQELVRTYQDHQIVAAMRHIQRKIENDEEIDFDVLKEAIARGAETDIVPVSWSHATEEFTKEWLWEGWVPHAELTMLVGQQEAGKSSFALYLVDKLVNGGKLPDNTDAPRIEGALWIETEGRQGENIRRAKAWGVDTDRIYSPTADLRRVLSLERSEDRALIRAHASRPEIEMIVIDSLGGSMVEENDVSAKKMSQGLSVLAQETNTTLLVIHHLRKPHPGKKKGADVRISLADVRGHSGITQPSPSVIGVDDPAFGTHRYLVPIKMNLARKPHEISFEISPVGLVFDDTRMRPSEVMVLDCIDWLKEKLADGPIANRKIFEMAEEKGFNKDVVARATLDRNIREFTIGREQCLGL